MSSKEHLARLIQSLHDLEPCIQGESFKLWLDALCQTKGNLLLTGVGKSGFVAQSLCAGLRAVGVSAHFVHGTEASHGDLGVFKKGDAAIVLSKSGQSNEIFPLINYCQKNAIPLFALTHNQESYLSQNASHPFLLPPLLELPPVTLLPTTSNIIFSALSELIKMAFVSKLNFNNEAFVRTHPGGKIGKNIHTTHTIMKRAEHAPIVHQNHTLEDTILVMSQKKCGCAIILDNSQKVLGIFTDGDLRRRLSDDALNTPIQNLMSKKPITITSPMSLEEAKVLMSEHSISQLLIQDEHGLFLGVVLMHDLILTESSLHD